MTTTTDTLELIKQAQQNPISGQDVLAKAFTQATGLVFIDLEPSAKTLYPVITPLRNQIPRVPGRGGTATNWRAITGININGLSLGVSEGRRGGTITTSVQSLTAAYKGFGLEDSVTFEADYAAQGFDNLRLRATEGLLRSVPRLSDLHEPLVPIPGQVPDPMLPTNECRFLPRCTYSRAACRQPVPLLASMPDRAVRCVRAA